MKRTFINQNQYEKTLQEDAKSVSCNQKPQPCKITNCFDCNLKCQGTNICLVIDEKHNHIAITQENNCNNKPP